MRNGLKVNVGEPVEVEIPADILRKIDGLPDSDARHSWMSFSPTDDEIILRYYNLKVKGELAKLVGTSRLTGKRGCTDTTMRKRYQELCEQRGITP